MQILIQAYAPLPAHGQQAINISLIHLLVIGNVCWCARHQITLATHPHKHVCKPVLVRPMATTTLLIDIVEAYALVVGSVWSLVREFVYKVARLVLGDLPSTIHV
jgi:hypothetical protein